MKDRRVCHDNSQDIFEEDQSNQLNFEIGLVIASLAVVVAIVVGLLVYSLRQVPPHSTRVSVHPVIIP